MTESNAKILRTCLRESIPEIFEAAKYLDDAVSAHLGGRRDVADDLIRRSNMPVIREWVESIWGKNSAYVQYRAVAGSVESFELKSGCRLRPKKRSYSDAMAIIVDSAVSR